ncbi:rhodanese-like domain-containing protein [Arcobacter arenosus]|jgi:rhodanese-related sulfurtransferase|uniref:Rhodanese-like domain-containing protein n=1 Tax=Arcobacter arenosus TaxID=2576037 RepID=A0A5R8Y4X3_9BACT|nr:rhodanese-like domain-containing protein [Arcobacter arenosus]TLP40820.1 rhodanese-like domain-containing protein [Arcobacter arenosus]
MKIVFFLFVLSVFSFAQFIGINPTTLQKKIDENVVVIDIRTPPEWIETGIVPSSKTLMFFDQNGNYDVDQWLQKFKSYVKDKNQSFVLVCRSGNRTGMVGNFLSKKLGYKNVFHLENGIKSWIREQRPTIKN